MLDRALAQVVEDLIAGKKALAGGLPHLLEVVLVEVAHAPGEDLPSRRSCSKAANVSSSG